MSKNAALLKKYKEEPKKMTQKQKDQLITEYAPLIKFIAQKIAVRLPSNIELDDLISAGVIGLMDAIDKYDPEAPVLLASEAAKGPRASTLLPTPAFLRNDLRLKPLLLVCSKGNLPVFCCTDDEHGKHPTMLSPHPPDGR